MGLEQGAGAFAASLLVVITSCSLFCFYAVMYRRGRCLLYPLYVQGVTAIVYTLTAFGAGEFIFATIVFPDGARPVAIGRYMSWMITCPTMLMGFFQTIGLLGPRISFTKINFIVTRDLVLMAAGVVASFQSSPVWKGVFLSIALCVSLSLVYETVHLELMRKDSYPGHLWHVLVGVTCLFFASWFIFPILYFLGPPVLDIISTEGEAIGHAIGDLLAKNMFGFACWYLRYGIIYPFIEGEEAKAAIVPMPGSVAKSKKLQYNGPDPAAGRSKPSKNKVVGSVLIVEPDVGYQRLFMYMLGEVGLNTVLAFSLDQAKQIILRSRLDEFDAVLVNLHHQFDNRQGASQFKKVFSKRPYHFPILGYTNGTDDEKLMEQETEDRHLCHATMMHLFDERYISRLVRHWRKTSDIWRRAAMTSEEEEQLMIGNGGEAAMSQAREMSFNSQSAPPDQDLRGVIFQPNSLHRVQSGSSQFSTEPPSLEVPQGSGMLDRHASHAALIDTDDPFRRWYDPSQSPRNPDYTKFNERQQQQLQQQQSGGSLTPEQQPASPPRANNAFDARLTVPGTSLPMETCSASGCFSRAQMQCGACHQRAYCGRDCQVRDWRETHKRDCATLRNGA